MKAGKTTLIKVISSKETRVKEKFPSTDGIEVSDWTSEDLTFHCWDFGNSYSVNINTLMVTDLSHQVVRNYFTHPISTFYRVLRSILPRSIWRRIPAPNDLIIG